MIPADNFTYATVQRSMLDLAKNYGFTHSDTSAIECLTSAVFHYMQQVSTDTKYSAEHAGRSAACSSDVLLATKNNRLDVESLNQYMIWNEPIKTSTELPQYPVTIKERSESPISDAELKERVEKDIPKFAPSIRFKPKVKKPPEEPVEEEEEENIDELTLAAMRICSSIKPITHAAKNVDEFDKLSLTLSEALPNFDHYSSKYEHEIDFLGNSLAAQEAAAAAAAVKEQLRLEEEAHRQKILEHEKLQYQQPQYYQQPEEPMIDFEDARQQKMVEFSKEFISEGPKPEIEKEEEPSRIESPMMNTLAEDLYVSPSPSPPPEIKPSYSQEPPPLKSIPTPVISESQPPITVQPNSLNDLNQNNETKNAEKEKEKHKKKHKHHKEKRREKDKKKDEERQHEEDQKKIKKEKHKEKKKEKKRDKDKGKDKEKHREKTKEKSPPILLPLQPPKLPAPITLSKIAAANAAVHQNAAEHVIKPPSQVVSKKPEKEQKKKEKKSKDLRPLKEPEILPMQKLKPPSSFKFRMPQPQTSGSSVPVESSSFIPPSTVNLSGSSSSSKGSVKDQSSYKSGNDESRPHKKTKDREKEKEKEREKGREKEKDKSLKRKHKEEPALIPNIRESSKNDGEKEHKMAKHDNEKKHDKEKKEKDRSNETPQEREERKRLKKEKKKREKEERKRKLEQPSNDSILGEPEQKKQKISEPLQPPPIENKPIKLKISLFNRTPTSTALAPPVLVPPVSAQTVLPLPVQNKVDTASKPPPTQSVAKQSSQSYPPKLPPSTFAPKLPSSSKPSSSKRTSSSGKSSSSRHHSSKKDRDETYRSSSATESTLNAPKIMSERQQMSKALKESMETANLIPPTSISSRSDRHSSEQRLAKKKRPEKDKLQEKKNKNGNLSLSSILEPPSLPSQLPPPLQFPPNESPPKLEPSAPVPENAEPANDEEDDKYSWCPNCGIRYVDGDNMVYCERCHYWYHWSCVGILSEPQEDQWYCSRCIDALKKEKGSKK